MGDVTMCWEMIGLLVWCQFVCVVGVLLFLIELYVNKFCGLSDERFFRRYGMVICCQKCCS